MVSETKGRRSYRWFWLSWSHAEELRWLVFKHNRVQPAHRSLVCQQRVQMWGIKYSRRIEMWCVSLHSCKSLINKRLNVTTFRWFQSKPRTSIRRALRQANAAPKLVLSAPLTNVCVQAPCSMMVKRALPKREPTRLVQCQQLVTKQLAWVAPKAFALASPVNSMTARNAQVRRQSDQVSVFIFL